MAKSDKPELKRVFGTDGNLGEQLGLTKDWVSRIMKAVGNYGETFDRNVGAGSKLGIARGLNAALEQGRNPVRAADPLIASRGLRRWPSKPRKPPPQFVAKLQRALGGRAGWGGFVVQILFVAALAWIGYEIVANARANLQTQRITAGFGFHGEYGGF